MAARVSVSLCGPSLASARCGRTVCSGSKVACLAPQAAFDLFGDRVKYWFTLNEPETFCPLGYETGA